MIHLCGVVTSSVEQALERDGAWIIIYYCWRISKIEIQAQQ